MTRWAVLALPLVLLQSPGPRTHLLVVSGIGGDEEHSARFVEWGTAMVDAAGERIGIPREDITFLAERVARSPERIDGRSTKEAVVQALVDIGRRSAAGDLVFILLIGHGSGSGEDSRLSLPGPDMTAAEFDVALSALSGRRVAFVNTATASGDFVRVLSGLDRTVITATKTSFERNDAVFGQYFVAAFSAEGADVDKDERVSLLEAFTFARLEVQREYNDDGRLLTEHAILDDNGDQEGSTEPEPSVSDGAVARALFLEAPITTRGVAPEDSTLAGLLAAKRQLEQQIADLRTRRSAMAVAEYEDALEALLVELTLTDRQIRARQGGTE